MQRKRNPKLPEILAVVIEKVQAVPMLQETQRLGAARQKAVLRQRAKIPLPKKLPRQKAVMQEAEEAPAAGVVQQEPERHLLQEERHLPLS